MHIAGTRERRSGLAGILMRRGILLFLIATIGFSGERIYADNSSLAKIIVSEGYGLARELEYVECAIQLKPGQYEPGTGLAAVESLSGETIPVQLFRVENFEPDGIVILHVIFPVSISPLEDKEYSLKKITSESTMPTDLSIKGTGFDRIIENRFYRADLTRSAQSEAKNHDSGQLRELFIKMGFDVLLFRTENRMHWAPNFQKLGAKEYETIAGWDNPKNYRVDAGPYLVMTSRRDQAPDYPEIQLSANYYFYAGLPWFRFYSAMDITETVWLSLLRNDEMTMDSLFTNVAFKRATGEIVDLSFAEREQILDEHPIENDAPWLCFYHSDKGYAFGSIRLKYDTTKESGFTSPVWMPHTKISNGADGGKYWNRRLIDDRPTFVPKGSRYVEENAYLVFRINPDDKFAEIERWNMLLKSPLQVSLGLPEK